MTSSSTRTAARIARKNSVKATKVVRDIPLKRIHDDIMKANPNLSLNTKDMRRWLRANMKEVHERNASWTFASGAEYDRVRAQFDAKYRAKIAPKATRKTKAVTPTPEVTPEPVSA